MVYSKHNCIRQQGHGRNDRPSEEICVVVSERERIVIIIIFYYLSNSATTTGTSHSRDLHCSKCSLSMFARQLPFTREVDKSEVCKSTQRENNCFNEKVMPLSRHKRDSVKTFRVIVSRWCAGKGQMKIEKTVLIVVHNKTKAVVCNQSSEKWKKAKSNCEFRRRAENEDDNSLEFAGYHFKLTNLNATVVHCTQRSNRLH